MGPINTDGLATLIVAGAVAIIATGLAVVAGVVYLLYRLFS